MPPGAAPRPGSPRCAPSSTDRCSVLGAESAPRTGRSDDHSRPPEPPQHRRGPDGADCRGDDPGHHRPDRRGGVRRGQLVEPVAGRPHRRARHQAGDAPRADRRGRGRSTPSIRRCGHGSSPHSSCRSPETSSSWATTGGSWRAWSRSWRATAPTSPGSSPARPGDGGPWRSALVPVAVLVATAGRRIVAGAQRARRPPRRAGRRLPGHHLGHVRGGSRGGQRLGGGRAPGCSSCRTRSSAGTVSWGRAAAAAPAIMITYHLAQAALVVSLV